MDRIASTISFIRDIYNTNEPIPLHAPVFNGNEKKYLLDTIDSTFVSSVGKYVDRLEEMMQTVGGVNKAVAVVNGTAALHIALVVAGVKQGDEVLTQALTFVATANAIAYCGAIPVFIDVDLDTMGLSPSAVNAFLEEHAQIKDGICYNKTTNKRISACVPMHTFGFPVHLEELIKVCDKWNISVVEDAAESLGSEYNGKATGGFGKTGIYSFNGNKIVTSGGGGIIVSNDIALGEKAKYLTTTAKKPHAYEFYHDELGYNYRMPNLNAALACAQIEQLSTMLERKREIAQLYREFFGKQGITFRTELPGTKANYWLMCLELENKAERDLFLKGTNQQKVMTRPIWQLMFRLPMYAGCQRDGQKNAEFLEERIVNIPSSVQ